MQTSIIKSVIWTVLLLAYSANAQVDLEPIDTASGCASKGLTGTVTYSTAISRATGAQRIPAGDFWEQQGAQWVFDTDTSGIEFSNLAIPGVGSPADDTPQADKDAIKLDDSKTKWTLVVPSGAGMYGHNSLGIPSSNGSIDDDLAQKDIVWQAASPTAAAPSTAVSAPSSTEAVTTSSTFVAGARFRRQADSSYNLKITGVVGCSDSAVAGPIATPTSGASGASNPTQASLCSNAGISTGTAAWSAYGVDGWFSSLLSANAPAPTAPQVDAAALLKNEVGAADNCGYTASKSTMIRRFLKMLTWLSRM